MSPISTGSVIPVALALNLPEPETTDLALIEVRFGFELGDNVELFFGKLDTLKFDPNAFAHGDGDEDFFNTALNYNPIATKTVPYSVLGAGFHLLRDRERVFTLAVLNSEETPTTVGISELFVDGAVIFSELRLPVTVLGRRGHQAIGGSWSSRTRRCLLHLISRKLAKDMRTLAKPPYRRTGCFRANDQKRRQVLQDTGKMGLRDIRIVEKLYDSATKGGAHVMM